MPTNLSDVNTFPQTLATPNDGEGATRASLEGNFLQGLLNRTRFLYNRLPNVGTAGRALAYPVFPITVDPATGGWSTIISSAYGNPHPVLNQTNNPAGGPVCFIHCRGPHNGSVKGFSVRLIGNSSHGALPASMPSFQLMKLPVLGTASEVAFGTDTSPSVAAYTVPHTILGSVGGGDPVITNSDALILKITGEHGANSLASGCTILAFSISFGE